MKEFLAIYLGNPDSPRGRQWRALDDAIRQDRQVAGAKAWHAWMDAHKSAIVVTGGPLGKTRRADPAGITETKNSMAAYVVVRAESHEAAAKLFENHPHFAIFPGESVEIMECLPIPGRP